MPDASSWLVLSFPEHRFLLGWKCLTVEARIGQNIMYWVGTEGSYLRWLCCYTRARVGVGMTCSEGRHKVPWLKGLFFFQFFSFSASNKCTIGVRVHQLYSLIRPWWRQRCGLVFISPVCPLADSYHKPPVKAEQRSALQLACNKPFRHWLHHMRATVDKMT